MLKLCRVSPIPGMEPVTTVLDEAKVKPMREMGFQIEVCEDQGMMSVIALRSIQQITGHQIILKSGESVVNMKIEEHTVSVVLRVTQMRERSQFIEVTHLGTRLYTFSFDDQTNRWVGIKPITIWDENFKPELIRTYGRSITPTEYVERLWFARECYRPGTSAQPMDSFERTMDGFASPGAERNWMVNAPRVGREGQIAYEANQFVGEE